MNTSEVRICKSRFRNKFCLKNSNNMRLTPWFSSYNEMKIGDFVKLVTDKGNFVFNINKSFLLYEAQCRNEAVSLNKLTEEVYYIEISFDNSETLTELYTSKGDSIPFDILEEVFVTPKGLIIAKELLGDWGVLSDGISWATEPKYTDVFDINRYGYAIGYMEESNSTDLIKITADGKVQVVSLEGCYVEQLTEEFILVALNKKYGVFNISGKKIIPIEYDAIIYTNGYFILELNRQYGLANRNGQIVRECNCHKIERQEDKFIVITQKITTIEEEIKV